MSAQRLTLPLDVGWHHFSLTLFHSACSAKGTCEQWVFLTVTQRILSPPGLAMPRERGKPRHAAQPGIVMSHDKRRVQQLERALSIAQTQCTERPRTPPMAYVEEVILEEPIQVPSESLLFTVPDDLQLPSHHTMSISTQAAMEGATCIIEEEFPGEFLHLDSSVPPRTPTTKVRKRQTRDGQGGGHWHWAGGQGHRAGGAPSLGTSTALCNP
jgi:hypothetical protein